MDKPSQAEGFLMAKRAVIFANGEVPSPTRVLPLLQPNDDCMAVDGGLRHLRDLKRAPKWLIGDLDSVSAKEVQWAEEQGVEIRRFKTDKDETDLELALLAAANEGYTDILIVGGLGGRLDHTLANLFLLMLPELANLRVTLTDGTDDVFLIRDIVEIEGKPGDRVSLIPINGAVTQVKTQNLKFPLDNETLYPEKSRGISNVMTEKRAKVSIGSGCLLCIHSRVG